MDIMSREPKLFWETLQAIADEETIDVKNNRDLDDILEVIEYQGNIVTKDRLKEHYKISVADQHGGEGQGDDFHYVIKIQDKHFMIPGYWMSHEGSELYWDDVYECVPYEKTVTDWKKAV